MSELILAPLGSLNLMKEGAKFGSNIVRYKLHIYWGWAGKFIGEAPHFTMWEGPQQQSEISPFHDGMKD